MTGEPKTAVADFLSSAAKGPAGLVIEGEAGIGKTTVWLADVEQARGRGFRVFSAQPAAAESVLAYASLADLLGGVDTALWADLPEPQRLALDQVLLRTAAHTATMERALQAGGDQMLMCALTMQAEIAAYAGRVDEARRTAGDALAASRRGGGGFMAGWQLTILGFIELSVGNHEAALSALEPLLVMLAAAPDATEIRVAAFVPDAVESFVALGRLDDAEPLIAALERNGRRLDRAWMLAVGARCRAMVLASRGDLKGANAAAQQAMIEHDRLPMPFERARTQLLLGQLQRRARQKDTASATLREALATFESLGIPLWAERARAEMARSNVGPKLVAGLTPSEQRVAELAASGMTNRDVAAALFISPKTVEANLSRIYHKLGIHSRAELGRRIGQPHGGNT